MKTSTRSKQLATVVTPEQHRCLKSMAAADGLSIQTWLGKLLDLACRAGGLARLKVREEETPR